jgi:hypothetical protein
MIHVATQTKNARFRAHERRNATKHDADKQTSSVATPTVTTPRKDSIYIQQMKLGMPMLSVGTLSVRTPISIIYQAKRSIGNP